MEQEEYHSLYSGEQLDSALQKVGDHSMHTYATVFKNDEGLKYVNLRETLANLDVNPKDHPSVVEALKTIEGTYEVRVSGPGSAGSSMGIMIIDNKDNDGHKTLNSGIHIAGQDNPGTWFWLSNLKYDAAIASISAEYSIVNFNNPSDDREIDAEMVVHEINKQITKY